MSIVTQQGVVVGCRVQQQGVGVGCRLQGVPKITKIPKIQSIFGNFDNFGGSMRQQRVVGGSMIVVGGSRVIVGCISRVQGVVAGCGCRVKAVGCPKNGDSSSVANPKYSNTKRIQVVLGGSRRQYDSSRGQQGRSRVYQQGVGCSSRVQCVGFWVQGDPNMAKIRLNHQILRLARVYFGNVWATLHLTLYTLHPTTIPYTLLLHPTATLLLSYYLILPSTTTQNPLLLLYFGPDSLLLSPFLGYPTAYTPHPHHTTTTYYYTLL